MNFAHILAYADFAHLAKKEKKNLYSVLTQLPPPSKLTGQKNQKIIDPLPALNIPKLTKKLKTGNFGKITRRIVKISKTTKKKKSQVVTREAPRNLPSVKNARWYVCRRTRSKCRASQGGTSVCNQHTWQGRPAAPESTSCLGGWCRPTCARPCGIRTRQWCWWSGLAL